MKAAVWSAKWAERERLKRVERDRKAKETTDAPLFIGASDVKASSGMQAAFDSLFDVQQALKGVAKTIALSNPSGDRLFNMPIMAGKSSISRAYTNGLGEILITDERGIPRVQIGNLEEEKGKLKGQKFDWFVWDEDSKFAESLFDCKPAEEKTRGSKRHRKATRAK